MKIIALGDSTLASFNDNTYYYPRYGYATKLGHYFNLEVMNLALSGRSSKSFTLEENYEIFKNSVSEGDYVIIGFGHNDEKSDDPIRFTNALLPFEDENSFMYSLYNNYIKIILEKGATPILCTPICRLTNGELKGNLVHQTASGDYSEAVRLLDKKLGLLCVDLTSYTKELYDELGHEGCRYHHAVVLGKKENNGVEPDFTSIDKTHLNMYGAVVMAGYVAKVVSESNLGLKDYLKSDLTVPSREEYLAMNPLYKLREYITPDLMKYWSPDHFSIDLNGWYGTAFGSCEVPPIDKEAGYFANSVNSSIIVGQRGTTHGKINFSSEGIAYAFRQISLEDNFKIEADITVMEFDELKQAGFGLMLRDDCYLNQETKNETILSHYVCAGMLTVDSATHINFSRELSAEINRGHDTFAGFYKKGMSIHVELERLGQRISLKTVFEGKEYLRDYYDFDLAAVDTKYMYVGFMATRSTVIRCDNINFEITSKAISA